MDCFEVCLGGRVGRCGFDGLTALAAAAALEFFGLVSVDTPREFLERSILGGFLGWKTATAASRGIILDGWGRIGFGATMGDRVGGLIFG